MAQLIRSLVLFKTSVVLVAAQLKFSTCRQQCEAFVQRKIKSLKHRLRSLYCPHGSAHSSPQHQKHEFISVVSPSSKVQIRAAQKRMEPTSHDLLCMLKVGQSFRCMVHSCNPHTHTIAACVGWWRMPIDFFSLASLLLMPFSPQTGWNLL